ncbi:hypothetical protein [Streptomyces sp. RPT161]|uniref:hypothetical protein n=1 Tax=Streptomyces sp. RPT161 TaxID=3015993 RepID=UPI0022B8F934|nr:hypothetical protein [Streptomyces sp. RPT161]
MTDDEQKKFDLAVRELASSSGNWYAQFQESRAEMQRQHPEGFDVVRVGEHAWQQLTPIQRARALPELFIAFYMRVYEQERLEQLNAAADEGKTYLEADDEHWLQEALIGINVTDPDAVANGVLASCLQNVLNELDLLRHRLAMAKGDQGGDQ